MVAPPSAVLAVRNKKSYIWGGWVGGSLFNEERASDERKPARHYSLTLTPTHWFCSSTTLNKEYSPTARVSGFALRHIILLSFFGTPAETRHELQYGHRVPGRRCGPARSTPLSWGRRGVHLVTTRSNTSMVAPPSAVLAVRNKKVMGGGAL